jgi:hypothetical protein
VTAPANYNVTLHHLSPDATAAGLAYPDEQLQAVTVAQLRDLLLALSIVATQLTIYEPSTPEIRIKTDREIFVVRTRYRRLCFVGWETILRGEDHSAGFILSTITGTVEAVKAAPKMERYVPITAPSGASPMAAGFPRWAKIGALTTLIIGFNATTAWMLLRPPPSLLPKHELLGVFESRALLVKVAGEYETGVQEGDRRLVIGADGSLRLAKFGPQRSVLEERRKIVRGALVDGRAALVTPDAVIVLKDADTVLLYGNTYRRHGI